MTGRPCPSCGGFCAVSWAVFLLFLYSLCTGVMCVHGRYIEDIEIIL